MPAPLMTSVPLLLDTPRLHLRPFTEADAPALHEALVESLDTLREHLWFLPWVAEEQTLASALARCRRAAGNFLLRTDLPYLAFARDSGRLVGSVGLHRTDWDLPKTEVGYWIRTSETGRGYASEGVRALRLRTGILHSRAAVEAAKARQGICRNQEWTMGGTADLELDGVKPEHLPDALCRVMLASLRVAQS